MDKPDKIKEKSFYDKVYDLVRQVPFGYVTTYGAVAEYLGSKGASRMVGWAMNNSHDKDVPAHRVVNRVGLLTGKHHFDGTNLMQQLLESENIIIIDNKVQDFEKKFWNPCKELDRDSLD